MEKSKVNRSAAALTLLLTCAAWFALDFPIRVTGAYGFPSGIGIKCFLPFSCGVFFGPAGVAGCALGSLAAGLLARTAAVNTIAEVLCVLLAGLGSHYGWFALNRDGLVRFERWRELGLYTAMTAVLSLLCGGVTALLSGAGAFLPTACAYLMMGVVVSIPVNILLGGIFCVRPTLPSYGRTQGEIEICLTPQEPGPDAVNEKIEEAALPLKIPMKRVFEIENCLEELYIRIRRALPDADVCGSVALGTTNSLRIRVPGEKYDPFQAGEGEDEIDLMSLKLLRHHALRASYSYAAGENRIHIVV